MSYNIDKSFKNNRVEIGRCFSGILHGKHKAAKGTSGPDEGHGEVLVIAQKSCRQKAK
jgi:hypothetical protein